MFLSYNLAVRKPTATLFMLYSLYSASAKTSHTFVLSSCRLDISGNVKVSDFGLAEDVYTRGYFRLNKDGSDNVRLPYKWIPPESFQDGVFSEKSDVVGDHNYTLLQIS